MGRSVDRETSTTRSCQRSPRFRSGRAPNPRVRTTPRSCRSVYGATGRSSTDATRPLPVVARPRRLRPTPNFRGRPWGLPRTAGHCRHTSVSRPLRHTPGRRPNSRGDPGRAPERSSCWTRWPLPPPALRRSGHPRHHRQTAPRHVPFAPQRPCGDHRPPRSGRSPVRAPGWKRWGPGWTESRCRQNLPRRPAGACRAGVPEPWTDHSDPKSWPEP